MDERPTLERSLTPRSWVGLGRCVEHYGRSEAYLPVLDALTHLAQGPERERLRDVLQAVAPLWLLQLPMLLTEVEVPALQAKAMGATPERMLREFADAVERLTRDQPLILILEDLHWSDHATVELLAFVARRQAPARLLILGSYRPVEVLSSGHPLAGAIQELAAHNLCIEISLPTLSEADIEAYLAQRFPVSLLPTRLAHMLYQRTEGNPLFLNCVLQDLIVRGYLSEDEQGWLLQGELDTINQQIPEDIRQLVTRQRERLPHEQQRLLQAASLVGHEFTTATVAAAIECTVTDVERHCQQLAEHQQFLQPAGISEWPDGTTSARYRFQHALYQQLWHERVPLSLRQDWHRQIGERLEVAYNGRAPEIAAELALHFEQGKVYQRAILYYQHAAQNALRRSASQEAIDYLQHGLSLLQHIPDTPERRQLELQLQVSLSAPLIVTKGYTAREVEQVCHRAQMLCQGASDSPQLFPAVFALFRFYIIRGKLPVGRELAEQLLRIARQDSEALFLPAAHTAMGGCLFHAGELPAVLSQVAQSLTKYDFQHHSPLVYQFGEDSTVIAHFFAAWTLSLLGYPEQAHARVQAAGKVGRQFTLPFIHLQILYGAILPSLLRKEWQAVLNQTEELLVLVENVAPLWTWLGNIWRGYALAEQGQVENGLALMRQNLEPLRLSGLTMWRAHHLGLLAEVCGKAEQVEEGLLALSEALTECNNGDLWYEAELWRIKGELRLAQARQKANGKSQTSKVAAPRPLDPDPQAEAEACFHKAIAIAQQQEAKSWELRASVRLARLWQRQGKTREAHQMLATVYNWFTEGFDTVDLKIRTGG